MTDTQLLILLSKYQKFLEMALKKVETALPETFEFETTSMCGQTTTRYPILDDLYDLGHDMEDDMDILGDYTKKD